MKHIFKTFEVFINKNKNQYWVQVNKNFTTRYSWSWINWTLLEWALSIQYNYTFNYKKYNCTKCASISSTAIHISRLQSKSLCFKKWVKQAWERLKKKEKNSQNHTKKGNYLPSLKKVHSYIGLSHRRKT